MAKRRRRRNPKGKLMTYAIYGGGAYLLWKSGILKQFLPKSA